MFVVGNEEYFTFEGIKRLAMLLQSLGTTKMSLIHREGNSKNRHLAAEKYIIACT